MKYALIVPSEKDRAQKNWPSLQMIGQGLEKAYRSALKDAVVIEAASMAALEKLPDKSCLIFPYAIPKQVHLIDPMVPLIHRKNLQCRVHVYGDFFQQWSEWRALLGKIKQGQFAAAALSSRFAQIIGRTLQTESDIPVLVPGLNLSSFAFNEGRRQKTRKELGLKSDELLILTVSRINDQKGFFRNYEVVEKLSKKHKVRWIIAGDFDDWNLPYAGEVFPAGYTFSTTMQFLKSQKPKFEINFMGHVAPARVSDLTQAADLFLHLSRSFEEDFSLAGREALASGLPCLFEDWGPFVDLTEYSHATLREKDISSVLGKSKERALNSEKAVERMKNAEYRKFLTFLSSSTHFDSRKMKALDVDQFSSIMEGRHE